MEREGRSELRPPAFLFTAMMFPVVDLALDKTATLISGRKPHRPDGLGPRIWHCESRLRAFGARDVRRASWRR